MARPDIPAEHRPRLYRSARDTPLDIVRGWLQVSVFGAHAVGSALGAWGIHAARRLSKASGQFLFLSGFVPGSVHTLKAHRNEVGAAGRDPRQRAGRAWLTHRLLFCMFGALILRARMALPLALETVWKVRHRSAPPPGHPRQYARMGDRVGVRAGDGPGNAPRGAFPNGLLEVDRLQWRMLADAPWTALLLHRPNYHDILPVFVLCMLALPGFLWRVERAGAAAWPTGIRLGSAAEPCRPRMRAQSNGRAVTAAQDGRWEAWMAAAQAGDARAYDLLLRDCLPLLRAIARRRIADRHEAEDAVQDTLLTIHRMLAAYDPARPARPWIAAIAERRCVDRLRRRGRGAGRETPIDDHAETLAAPPGTTGEDRIAGRQLRDAVAELPESQRTALRLAKLEDLPLAEAAARSGLSIGALKVATHRALKTLRRRLGGEE